ncbi:MAG TPA: ammonia channel protein, partial [Caldimonas sp.]
MKKLIATLALGLAVLGFAGSTLAADAASDAAASAPAMAAAPAPAPAMAAADAASAPAASASTPAPVPNKGDNAWMIVATALVIM